jgi:hypothetical protein
MRAKSFFGSFLGVAILTASLSARASAQETEAQRNDRLVRERNITATGATVPLPGKSKSAGETSLDRRIQQKDNQIDKSICTNC